MLTSKVVGKSECGLHHLCELARCFHLWIITDISADTDVNPVSACYELCILAFLIVLCGLLEKAAFRDIPQTEQYSSRTLVMECETVVCSYRGEAPEQNALLFIRGSMADIGPISDNFGVALHSLGETRCRGQMLRTPWHSISATVSVSNLLLSSLWLWELHVNLV